MMRGINVFYDHLVGVLEQFPFFQILEQSSHLTHIFQRGRSTTNQSWSMAELVQLQLELHFQVHHQVAGLDQETWETEWIVPWNQRIFVE